MRIDLTEARVQVWFQNRRELSFFDFYFVHVLNFFFSITIFSLFKGAKWRKNEKCDDKEVPTSSNYELSRHENNPLPSTSTSNCTEQSVPQQQSTIHQNQQQIMEADSTKLLHTSDDRLSPNIFLNLNFDNTIDHNVNNLKFEWSTFNPNIPVTTNSVPSMMNMKYQNMNSCMSTSPTYEFLNIDHFNIDSFKNECILSLDQNIMSSVNDSQVITTDNMHNFTMDEEGKDLLDLEKPININVTNLETEKYC
jgi:hypothetical protein